MENCEICEKRFSVTAYSRAGPSGGLLCPKCSKDLDKEEGGARKKRKIAAGRARRNAQSQLLDGTYPGAKSLVTLCIETLAKHVDMAEDLGDLPTSLVDKLAAILAKRRLMSPVTLDLFLKPGVDTITVYDGAKLGPDDYIRIFQIVPTVKYLRLRNAVQFKNKVMDHLLGTKVDLESLSLHGANLIDDDMWNRYFNEKGSHLKAFKIAYTDGHFGDEQIELMTKNCLALERLKISHNQKVTDKGIKHISQFKNLKHLSLEFYETATKSTTSESYVEVLNSVGPGLRTFSLETAHTVNDTILDAIHENCQSLSKLRITDNEVLTDQGFANLFTNWLNPPLSFIDFHKCRHIDASEPRENPDNIGLCSSGFEALMKHSGSALRLLKLQSCRHISYQAFENIFGGDLRYPELQEMDLSFCQAINDFMVGCIFRSCPNLLRLKVFGNFGVRDIRIPKGRILIGVPTALGMQIDGTEDADEGRFI
jgi:DNA repair protein RAD7